MTDEDRRIPVVVKGWTEQVGIRKWRAHMAVYLPDGNEGRSHSLKPLHTKEAAEVELNSMFVTVKRELEAKNPEVRVVINGSQAKN